METQRRNLRLMVRMNEREKRMLDRLASQKAVPASWIVRNAIKREVKEWRLANEKFSA